MDKDTITRYAPMAIVVISIIFQWNLFVKPVDLEKTHREIVEYMTSHYVSKEEGEKQENRIIEMQKKIDKIYDIVVLREK